MNRWALPLAGAAALAVTLVVAPGAALAGWRAAFLAFTAVTVGAVALLLIARLTGAAWGEPLRPLAAPLWLLFPAFLPVVVHQALTVPRPLHLVLWLSWPLFLLRGLLAIGLWWWLGRLARAGGPAPLWAGLGLVAHGILLTIVGTDWLLGASPGQPESAVAMVWTTLGVLGACGAACLLELGPAAARRDLSFLLVAGGLGLAYLLFMDFLIVWYGELPGRIGWYVERTRFPWVALPPLALVAGLFVPVAGVGLVRTDAARRVAGGCALAAVLLVACWFVGPPVAWSLLAALGGAALATAALGSARA